MEYRQLGSSGLKVPALSFGTGTFGGGNEFFRAWGSTDVQEASRLVDICLEAGVNLFDTATFIPVVSRKRFSEEPFRDGAIRCSFQPRRRSLWAKGRMISVLHGIT